MSRRKNSNSFYHEALQHKHPIHFRSGGRSLEPVLVQIDASIQVLAEENQESSASAEPSLPGSGIPVGLEEASSDRAHSVPCTANRMGTQDCSLQGEAQIDELIPNPAPMASSRNEEAVSSVTDPMIQVLQQALNSKGSCHLFAVSLPEHKKLVLDFLNRCWHDLGRFWLALLLLLFLGPEFTSYLYTAEHDLCSCCYVVAFDATDLLLWTAVGSSRIRLDDQDAAPMLNDGPIAVLNVEDCSLLPLEYNSNQLSGCRGLDAVFLLFVGCADAHWLVVSLNGFAVQSTLAVLHCCVMMPTGMIWLMLILMWVATDAGVHDALDVSILSVVDGRSLMVLKSREGCLQAIS
ncbi:hypothetical protein Nepgr_018012 [Nepenthes gracilis]|uniref:Uncharacterized protein n=1 Tax=Nepenthes gracilis TaxID=150966 RepID=A0AAD3XTX0_NEPGR|nr:hypothetical protein Nepgr_018012 [Nepenthes gracilis]